MPNFALQVLLVGKVTPDSVVLLGTAFIVGPDGLLVTSRHVVGNETNGIVVLAPNTTDIDSYQDVSDTDCFPLDAEVVDLNPIADLVILKVAGLYMPEVCELGSLDEARIGDTVEIYGFPHCVDGRRVLTYQSAIIGAKVLLQSSGIKVKHAVVNWQTRPGQSGSLVFSSRLKKVVGLLSGTYVPQRGGYAVISGINPQELNQTSHIVSAEYIKGMIE